MLRQDLATLPDERKSRKAAAVARASNNNLSVVFDNGERPIVPLVSDSSSTTRLDLQLQGEYNQDCEWANSLAAWRQEHAAESKRAADEEAPPVQLLEPQRFDHVRRT